MGYIHEVVAAIPDWPDPNPDPDWTYYPWLHKLIRTLENLGATVDWDWVDENEDEDGYKEKEHGGRFWTRGGVNLPKGGIILNKRLPQREGTRGQLLTLAHEGGHWMEYERALYDPETGEDQAERAAYLYGWGLLSLIGATAPKGPVSKRDWRVHHSYNTDLGDLILPLLDEA